MFNVGDKVKIVDSGMYGVMAAIVGHTDSVIGQIGLITRQCETGAFMVNTTGNPDAPEHDGIESAFHYAFKPECLVIVTGD